MMMILALTLSVIVSLFQCTCALDYLSPGFAHVNLNDLTGANETFQIEDFYNIPVTLNAFELVHIPKYVKLKSPKFTLVQGTVINDKQVYYNGEHYLFFIQNVDPYGTWLLGDKLGVDSGIAYLRPAVHSLVPLDIESAKNHWNFLKDGKWVAENAVRVAHVEPQSEEDIIRIPYHSISYFHQGVFSPSVLLTTPVDSDFNSVAQDSPDKIFRFTSTLRLPFPTPDWKPDQYPLFWNLQTNQWTSVTLRFQLPMAKPVVLTRETSQVVHLVGHELSENGWRIFLREDGKDDGKELEVQLHLSKTGLPSECKIASFNGKKRSMVARRRLYNMNKNKKMMQVEKGSYLWLWFHAEPDTVGESRYLGFTSDNFLLKCVGKVTTAGAEKFVFEYHHSHRRKAMDRTVLSLTTSLVTAAWNSDINALEWSLDGSPLIADAVFAIGPDPVTWLRAYLLSHEGFLSPGLSSCFMYHGGMSMPQQLIYAAEMVCVLIGTKPITMIQYTSSADHQWKFPLVPELTQAIIAGRVLMPPLSSASGGVDVQYNMYQVTTETLIFYRPKQRDMLHLLRPNHTAQALHIVPFPAEAGEDNPTKMDRVLREQIYNSWWNGYLLGYPVRFIESYLRSFDTKLSLEVVEQEMHRAQRDVESHFRENDLRRSEIRVGSNTDLLSDEELMSYFASSIQ